MLFNSLEFFIFLPVVYFLYRGIFNNNLKKQNFFLLLCSYIFYGWWDWRFLSLIILSTITDYLVGKLIYNSRNKKNRLRFLFISIFVNILILGFFKYFNFFVDSWFHLIETFGYKNQNLWTLNIILPIGISFYTFQTMSYSLDIYRKNLKPTNDFISFAAYVSFFPQLVAGPIERAKNLLPQINRKRNFNYEQTVQGLRLILWGLFKKVVIADSLSHKVDWTFANMYSLDGGTLFIGLVYFAFQIYCDFSGYSDIAIGTAKLFGIELMSNFKFPYFSRNIGEFWRRWHISLSTWFRDYIYIPLGGSKRGKIITIRNIFIIFVVSGFWHGAKWTFIVWGIMHALMFVPFYIFGLNRRYITEITAHNSLFPNFIEALQMVTTFTFTTIAWVFFRSNSIEDALFYLQAMITKISIPPFQIDSLLLISIVCTLEWLWRDNERNPLYLKNKILRYSCYTVIYYSVISFSGGKQQFIYFQF